MNSPQLVWLCKRAAEAFDIESEDVADKLQSTAQPNEIAKVFSGNGAPVFVVFKDGDTFHCTSDPSVPFAGKIFYLIRMVNRNITVANLESDMMYGTINDNYIQTLELLLQRVYYPLVENQEDWGCLQNRTQQLEFLQEFRKFVDNLQKYIIILEEKLTLTLPPEQTFTNLPTDSQAINKIVQESPDTVLMIENSVAALCNEIEQFLVDSEKIRLNSDDSSPESEQVFWKTKMSLYNSVGAQMQSIPWIGTATRVLLAAQSVVLSRWNKVRQRVLESTNESKDNLKYLSTIDDILEPLYSGEPGKMTLTIPDLMETIRVVHSMAKYYGNRENMTILLIKISNQMIKTCREYIYAGCEQREKFTERIFDADYKVILHRIDDCITLLKTYSEEYAKIKEKLLLSGAEKEFNFSEQAIFGNFELFCNRLKKVADIIITRQNFSSLISSTIIGLEPIIKQQEDLINVLKTKPYDPLAHRMAEFDNDYEDYKKGIIALENSLTEFINAKFSDDKAKIDDLIMIMLQLNTILNRPNLQELILTKYDILLQKYTLYVKRTAEYYNKIRKGEVSPAIASALTPIAGRACWCRLIESRLGDVYNFFKRIYVAITDEQREEWEEGIGKRSADNLVMFENEENENIPMGYMPLLMFNKHGRNVSRIYQTTIDSLRQYELNLLKQWGDCVQPIRESLQSTVLVEQPNTGKLFVNFDTMITELCKETDILISMKATIPDNVKAITLHKDGLFSSRDQLIELVSDIENLESQIHPDCVDLFEPMLYKLQRKIQPLLTSISWTSLALDMYIKVIRDYLEVIKETCKKVNDIIGNRIIQSLKEISNTAIIPLNTRVPFGGISDESVGGTQYDENSPSKKAVLENYTAATAPITSYAEKLFSNYLEQNSTALPFKKYLEKAKPHSQQAAEFIYLRSMFIAAATCDIVTTIASRYLTSADGDNAESLKTVVMQNIVACFDPSFSEPVRAEDEKKTTSQIIGDSIRRFIKLMHDKVQKAIYESVQTTFTSLSNRLQQLDLYKTPADKINDEAAYDALIQTDCELIYPDIELIPNNEKIQLTIDEMINLCLTMCKMIPKWNSQGDYYQVVLQSIPPITFINKDGQFEDACKTLSLTKNELNQTVITEETVEVKKTASAVYSGKAMEEETTATSRMANFDYNKVTTRLEQLEQYGIHNTEFSYIGNDRQMLKKVISIEYELAQLFAKINSQVEAYSQFDSLYKEDKETVFKKFLDQKPQLEEYVERIIYYEKIAKTVELLPDYIQQGILLIKTDELKEALLNEASIWKNQYATKLNNFAQLQLSILTNTINDVQQEISGNINDLDDVRKIMAALSRLRELEADFDNKVFPIEQTYQILNQHNIKVSTEEVEEVDELNYRLKTIQQESVKIQSQLQDLESGFKSNLVSSVQEFLVTVDQFGNDWKEKGPRCDGIPPRTAVIRLREFEEEFTELERKWVTYSTGEKLFGLPITEYPILVHIQKDLKLLNELYGLYTDVLTTIDGYADKLWSDLDFEEIQGKMTDFENRCLRLPKDMREWEAFLELKQKIDDFNQILPIFEGMANDAMKDRHWQEISEKTHCEQVLKIISDPESFKLSDILACDPVKHAEDIEDICNAATKETDIELKLNTVRDEWKEMKFTFDDFKTRGKVILKASDTSDLIAQLEDSQMLLSSIQSNRFNKPFKDEIFQWVKRLSTLDETLTLWLQVQENWIYLEAVFSSGDIARQLPAEAKRFGNIDKTWIKIMGNAFLNPGVIYLTSQDDTLKSLLPHLIGQLEECEKSLSGYLEQKRNLFPRFYFVSDPVLLEILGQQSDPHAIQNHLLSIFDSVAHVDFDKNQAKRNNIVALNDKTGESVTLSIPVTASGPIEDWLNNLIAVMQRSIKDIARQAAQDLARPDYKDLLKEYFETYPAQVTLLCLQIIWTLWCEQAFRQARSDKRAIENVVKKNNEVFDLLVEITKQQEMIPRQRTNIETLITIHVHERDIFNDLVAAKVRSLSEFDWLKQTRFYWNTEMDTCRIEITDSDFTYGYEYLGVNERLVITPLTDRCYITLAQALQFCLGGAPAGPAGTGKTETVKDLGKSLGNLVVVFNCSDQMDYRGLGAIFRGVAQTGCFGDFDEFNRVELDVMSVAAEEIACVLSAIKEKKKQFLYTDGCMVSLIPSAGYFITMNPGYAGREELLENLKALFRSVSMMVPDRQIIIDVKLAAAGFSDSKILAKKFFILYELCTEELSQQRHYDFGLRNILSVLRNCGSQRRQYAHDKSLTEQFILLRVLRDMNRSKLVAPDIPLFESLTNDLFPGVKPPENKYEDLEQEIVQVTEQLNIQRQPDWEKSVIQFYETYNVRHSIMLLGPTLAGKSCTLNTLAKCLQNMLGSKFQVIKMNPKAITAPEMFGKLDATTGDWTDGIFSALWRKAVKEEHYILLTLVGPVDAVWIENLNTVMDDNKTLTLANSDRIPMSKTLKLILEIDSLENASPATVSRAGMIYMSGFKAYGWRPFYQSWIEGWRGEQVNILTETLDQSGLLDALYKFMDLEVKPIFNVPALQLARQLLFLITSMIYDGCGLDSKLQSPDEKVNNQEILTEAVNQSQFFASEGFVNSQQAQYQCIAKNAAQLVSKMNPATFRKAIVFAIMWSFGAILDLDDRKVLQKFLLENQVPREANLSLPQLDGSQDQIFNYFINDAGEWQKWQDVVPTCEYPSAAEIPFRDILVPTIDNVTTTYLLQKLNKSQFNILLSGESGSGKTKDIFTFLSAQDKDKYAIREINFSSATTMGILQQNIESFVEKRMGTNYGPIAGKSGIVFIDEINIPQINEWGDQPTNELTRQIIEERGLYSLDKPGEFHSLQDLTFIGAMPIPGGGRNDIPNRLKSQFCTFNINLPSPEQLDIIFGTFIKGHYSQARGFADDVVQTAAKLVSATRKLWQATKVKMLPTPEKFHYVFNLRDLSRITQGFINAESDIVTNSRVLVHLWANECSRVLPDKFTNENDINWFNNQLYVTAQEELNEQLANEVQNFVEQGGENKYIYFSDFMRDPPEDVPEDQEVVIPKIYEPIYDRSQMVGRLDMYMKEHNDKNRKGQLNLVLFDSCIEHILRISRIIRTPGGHCLLVGVGGSGKESCARMATFIAGYDLYELVMSRTYNISNFEEDLRKLYKQVGLSGKGCSFIFTDNDIKEEIFLEKINNILTSGEIPALFPKDEVESIINDIRPAYKKEHPRGADTNEILWNFFIQRNKENLHIILCFSPASEKFRQRSQKFPGLVSGCTTDWFESWSREALEQVANQSLSHDIDVKVNNDTIIPNLIQFIANIHSNMVSVTQQYFEQYRRQTYVTPKSYLSFLQVFKSLYNKKVSDLSNQNNRLKKGLEILQEAGDDVAKMRVELEVKEKELAVAQAKTDEMMKEITIKKTEAEKVKHVVQKDAEACQKQAAEIQAEKSIAEEGLAAAMPLLEKAEAALNSITAKAINNVKVLGKPPYVIQKIFDAVLILFNEKMEKLQYDPDKAAVKGCLPSWQQSITVMQKDILKRLQSYDKDSITDEQCELLLCYIDQPDFKYENAAKSFGDVAGLFNWVISMREYHFIAQEVEPKRRLVREMEAVYRTAMEKLKKAQDELDAKQAALNELQAVFDKANAEKQALQDEADLTQKRLGAASALINGLSGERKRWGQQAKELDDAILRLVGDVTLAAAFQSYAGPFNQEYREKLLTEIWLKDLIERKLPYTKNIENEIIEFLVSEAEVGEWRLEGLPTDDLSTENGLIVSSSSRYPLMIDPENQAATWIKNMYKNSDIKVTTLNNKRFRMMLEMAVENGFPLLIEDVEEELDPVLDPILEKQYTITGTRKEVKIGDETKIVDDHFKLFITTRLPNPKYSPETYAKTSIIDFTVTFGGLEEQLLSRTVNIERKELEEQRVHLLEEINTNKKIALQLEEDLLNRLSNTTGNLLDDADLVEVLNKTKATTEEVKEKLVNAAETEKRINEAREEYLPVATRGAIIYFLITDMSLVNNMYETSLKQFLELFDQSISQAPTNNIAARRIELIIHYMTFKLFKYVVRGLYERDKLLFTLNLCLQIDIRGGKITDNEFKVFIRGGASLDLATVRSKPSFITDAAWLNVVELSQKIPQFNQLQQQITENEGEWKTYYNEEAVENAKLPSDYEGRVNEFQRLLLIRCLREDRTMLAASSYITACLSSKDPNIKEDGRQYVEPVVPDYDDILTNETNACMPMCFLLSLGSDPTSELEVVSKKRKIELKSISMGQGQEPSARRLIAECVAQGGWVMINNSHLAIKFMAEIDDMILDIRERSAYIAQLQGEGDELSEDTSKKQGDKKEEQVQLNQGTGGIFAALGPKQGPHQDFRLILTTEESEKFPIGLLEKCIKLTNDPPSGLRAGLKRTFGQMTQDLVESVDKPEWLPLVYAIAYLHSSLIERKKFGPLGWCTKYEFGEHDFNASIEFLQSYLYSLDPRKNQSISWKTICYMIAEVHYGGRITDDFDRRLMNTYAFEWISPAVLEPGYEFSANYRMPTFTTQPPTNINDIRKHVDALPMIDKPQAFLMHPNAELTYRSSEAHEVLGTILSIQPKDESSSKNSGGSREDIVLKEARDILAKLPPNYDFKVEVPNALKLLNGDSAVPRALTVFLGQEIERMQKVLSTVRTTLVDLQQAIAGTIIMTEHLQDALNAIFDARVPAKWLAISWSSSTLGYWLSDVTARCNEYTSWLKEQPYSFWLTGFFNPTGFLTSVKQEITRSNTTNGQPWSLDKVQIETIVQKFKDEKQAQSNKPKMAGSVYIHGLYLEGAEWEPKKEVIVDAAPKQLFAPLPVLLVEASENTGEVAPVKEKSGIQYYDCPVYKTPMRTGLNFIFCVKLRTEKKPSFWTLRGTALLCNSQ